MTTDTNPESHWLVEYDVDPIRVRDPVAEALGVLDSGTPFAVTYEDVVRAAGHSCPTAAGAFRIAQVGLDALYPETLPVRSEIAVAVPGPRGDATYGVLARLLSVVTGAAAEDGFGGLAGGYGGRRDLLAYDAFDAPSADPTVRVRRTDTGDAVQVRYRVGDVPPGGPGTSNLPRIVEGTATDEERTAFREDWHARVQHVLATDDLFEVTRLDA